MVKQRSHRAGGNLRISRRQRRNLACYLLFYKEPPNRASKKSGLSLNQTLRVALGINRHNYTPPTIWEVLG